MPFRDYFSAQAQQYARHRPQYPGALFDYLATLAPAHECAWDCGAGNGQAAVELARHFQRVIATDASEEQIQNAFTHERVDYRVEQAEKTSIHGNSVDLISITQPGRFGAAG
jgi:2-polyprenyl-3-methyl-5-hydroxy-6-metoxy-1,4-benzoquinol methylase